MLTNFQCDLCRFRNIKGRDPTEEINKYERLIISIRRASLDAFWSIEPGTVRDNLTMLSNMGTMSREDLSLGYCFSPLGPYPLKE